MKRFLIFLFTLSLFFSLSACQSFTVDTAIAAFEDDIYLKRNYGDDMISPIRESIEADAGREIEIVAIIHVINQETSVPNLEWTYIYEFSKKEDATWFEENRSAYVSSLEEGRCVRFGSIVIFGTSSVIDTLSE